MVCIDATETMSLYKQEIARVQFFLALISGFCLYVWKVLVGSSNGNIRDRPFVTSISTESYFCRRFWDECIWFCHFKCLNISNRKTADRKQLGNELWNYELWNYINSAGTECKPKVLPYPESINFLSCGYYLLFIRSIWTGRSEKIVSDTVECCHIFFHWLTSNCKTSKVRR